MKRLVSATVLAATLLTGNAYAVPPVSLFNTMLAETGCKSKFSDEKKADIYATKYKGTQMTVTGEIATLNKGDVTLKVLRDTLTFDVKVDMADPKSTYDLEKGQKITVTFTVDGHGGCFLSYHGKDGVVQ